MKIYHPSLTIMSVVLATLFMVLTFVFGVVFLVAMIIPICTFVMGFILDDGHGLGLIRKVQ
jgi:uncharacterized membrane protein